MAELTDADRERLREICEADWVEAALAGDWDAAMALCTDDFRYLPQDHPLLTGKEAAKGFLETFPAISSFTQSLDAAMGNTDLAAVRGTFSLTMLSEGQELSGQGKFLCTVAKRGEDWLLSNVCFNWDAPPA